MAQGLSQKEKLLVYGIGVVLGFLLLSYYQRTREDGDGGDKRFLTSVFQSLIEEAGLRNLPEGSPDYLRDSELLGYLATRPDETGQFEYIWILSVREGHPRIRVVESLKISPEKETLLSVGYRVMAADEILVSLQSGATVEQLDALLEEHAMQRISRYQSTGEWVVRLDQWDVLSVPKAIAILEKDRSVVKSAKARLIHWK